MVPWPGAPPQPVPEVPVIEVALKDDAAVRRKLADAAATSFDLLTGPLCRVRAPPLPPLHRDVH
jgi:hypothetical protein